MQRLAELDGMYSVDFDQCMFGQQVMMKNGEKGMAKKRTRVYTNSEAIDNLLNRQCDGRHEHVVLLGGVGISGSCLPQGHVRCDH